MAFICYIILKLVENEKIDAITDGECVTRCHKSSFVLLSNAINDALPIFGSLGRTCMMRCISPTVAF